MTVTHLRRPRHGRVTMTVIRRRLRRRQGTVVIVTTTAIRLRLRRRGIGIVTAIIRRPRRLLTIGMTVIRRRLTFGKNFKTIAEQWKVSQSALSVFPC